MEQVTDPYIKLSRIRDDYGLEGRQGTSLHLSELNVFSKEQLKKLRKALTDECQDIEYQISYEMTHPEKGAKWMYGCKNSLRARNGFVERINELLVSDSNEPISIGMSVEIEICILEQRIRELRGKSVKNQEIVKSTDTFSPVDMQ